jgi:argininosuccinate lyase
MAEDRGVKLSELSVADLQSIHPLFADDVAKVGALWSCVPVDWWSERRAPRLLLMLAHTPTRHTPTRHTQVWDFSASADARDTEGGASKRSLMEQVSKMRAYLEAEKA